MDDKEKNLTLLRNEMENVRELYLKGFIDKKTYQIETRNLFEIAVKYGA
jgi:hypothetical protein